MINNTVFYEATFQSMTEESKPDTYIPNFSRTARPTADFIISKTLDGTVLSRYGDDTWALWPYATTPRKAPPLIFSGFSEKTQSDTKWLMFILIYLDRTGRANTPNPGTLRSYMTILKSLCVFSDKNNTTPCEVLGEVSSLKKFVMSIENKPSTALLLVPILLQISFLGKKLTDINVIDTKTIEEIRLFYRSHQQKALQHAVIPPRIFSHLLNEYWSVIDIVISHKDNLFSFIKRCISNKAYARARNVQYSLGLRKNEFFPFFNEAIKIFSLVELFERFSVDSLRKLTRVLTQVQHTCKELIHIYSGMRDREVLSLKIDCLHIEKNQDGSIAHLLGETSKLVGQRKTTAWVTSKEIKKAIDLAGEMALIVAHYKNVDAQSTPLFAPMSYLSLCSIGLKDDGKINLSSGSRSKCCCGFNLINSEPLKIMDTDVQHLEKIDPLRSWREESKFQIGEKWITTTHQWRRSLAFYVAQSGLVSLPTLRRQLQHITREMTLYYCNGAGFSDLFNTTEHFKQELINTKPEADALAYIYNVILSDETFKGAHGYHIKNNCDYINTDLKLFENRKKTISMFKNGELAYKETALGVCTSASPCDKKLLRSMTACFSCPKAAIKPSKVTRVIDRQQQLLARLDKNSVEFRTEEDELKYLLLMQEKLSIT